MFVNITANILISLAALGIAIWQLGTFWAPILLAVPLALFWAHATRFVPANSGLVTMNPFAEYKILGTLPQKVYLEGWVVTLFWENLIRFVSLSPDNFDFPIVVDTKDGTLRALVSGQIRPIRARLSRFVLVGRDDIFNRLEQIGAQLLSREIGTLTQDQAKKQEGTLGDTLRTHYLSKYRISGGTIEQFYGASITDISLVLFRPDDIREAKNTPLKTKILEAAARAAWKAASKLDPNVKLEDVQAYVYALDHDIERRVDSTTIKLGGTSGENEQLNAIIAAAAKKFLT